MTERVKAAKRMIKKLETDFKHIDERGVICQILSETNSQVNYLFTKKGAKRGSHYHKKNHEYFYIIHGRVIVFAYSIYDSAQTEEHVFEAGDLFVVEPFVMHDFTFVEDTQMVVMYDYGVESDKGKDIFTE